MITKTNFDKIAAGMTQEDVEEIFGCPPGDYTNGQAVNVRCGIGVRGIRQSCWIGYEGDIDVEFSRKDGKVVGKHFMETWLLEKPALLDRMKGLLRLARKGQ
jgi:hypothetical protein